MPAGGERAEAGQRVAGPPLRRHALRGLPRQRGRDWRAAGRRRHARLGATVRLAVEATARWTRSNTNLGIVLLLAPLARAALAGLMDEPAAPGRGRNELATLSAATDARPGARRRPPSTTRARCTRRFVAPRRAGSDGRRRRMSPTSRRVHAARGDAAGGRPGRDRARVRDRVRASRSARACRRSSGARARRALLGRRDRRDVSDAARRRARTRTSRGAAATALAADVSQRARDGARRPVASGRTAGPARHRRDGSRRCAIARNTANPGTTADLTAAAIFVVLLGGGWSHVGHGDGRT